MEKEKLLSTIQNRAQKTEEKDQIANFLKEKVKRTNHQMPKNFDYTPI